jgi:hypothetical protein
VILLNGLKIVINKNDKDMNVTKISSLTGKENTLNIDVTPEQLLRIESRRNTSELIQNIVPNLSMEDREFLMTGITHEEWIRMFGEID